MSANGGSVVTIGTYDGVHRGHQRLIGGARAEAERRGLRSVVVTFDRHPSVTVRPATVPKLITDLELKLELIEGLGVDEVVVLSFDAARASETPESFAEDLVTDLEAELVLVGENFRFGHDHRGDVSLLERLGRKLGYEARGIALVTDEVSQVVVSSRHIRSLIADGALGDVARFLGRPFELSGTLSERGGVNVVTALPDVCWPPPGSYTAVLRRPNEVPAGPPGIVVLDDQGRAEVLSGALPSGLTAGGRVGLCFTDPD